MSDIEFIMTAGEITELCEFLFKEFNAVIHIDNSTHEKPETISSGDEMSDYISTHEHPSLLFITSSKWGDKPLYTKYIKTNDGRSYYYIMQRYGGPAFTWMIPKKIIKDNATHLIQGFIGDYSWFYVRPDSSDTFDRPKEMSDAYKKITSFIKKKSVRSRFNVEKAGPWISEGSVNLVRKGALLGGDGQWSIIG
jgi:hypothetical protein